MHSMFTMLMYPLSSITPPSENLWAYLGETNVFNVLVVLVLFVVLYKSQGWNIAKGLDAQIQSTVGDLQDAEMLQTAVVLQQEELQNRLTRVEQEREERLQKANERGEAYAKELQETTQRKFRQLRDKQDEQKTTETERLEKRALANLSQAITSQAIEKLRQKVDTESAETLLWEAFDDVANAYQKLLPHTHVSTGKTVS